MRLDKLYLVDMVDAATAIAAFVDGETRESFVQDDMRRSAVLKKLEIIGEASGHLSDPLKARYPEVPWRKMIGMRHVGVHAYFSINWNVVWETATSSVPEALVQLAAILAAEFPEVAQDAGDAIK